MAEVVKPKLEIPSTCESFRPIVEKYFGSYTDQALFVASKESRRCTVNIADGPNKNGTWDYCIFQINNEPSTRLDTEHCVARAHQKFVQRKNTWSAWYAVCTVDRKPKYEGIKCG